MGTYLLQGTFIGVLLTDVQETGGKSLLLLLLQLKFGHSPSAWFTSTQPGGTLSGCTPSAPNLGFLGAIVEDGSVAWRI